MEEPNDLYKDTVREFLRAGRAHRGVFERYVSTFGIHNSQHHLLMFLSHAETMPTQKAIAEHFGISPAAVAVSVRKLEGGGYLEKCPSGDARENRIAITEKGKDVIERTHRIFRALDRATFAGFSEEDMLAFSGYLARIRENLESIAASPEEGEDIG